LALLTGHSDGLVITATLNSLGMLIHRRPIAANKILSSLFKFNPLKLANAPMTPKNKVVIKSIERTTRALMMNIMKRYALLPLLSAVLANVILGTPRTQSMDGYSSISSICIAPGLSSLMSLVASDQHLLSRPMALMPPRGSELRQRPHYMRSTLYHLFPQARSATANCSRWTLRAAL
jgi:hypothetical protein